MDIRSTLRGITVLLLLAGLYPLLTAAKAEDKTTAVAGASVTHNLHPDGQVVQPEGTTVHVPPRLIRDAQVHASVATSPIVEFSGQKPAPEFTAFADRPAPDVVPRKQLLNFYPCSRCHQNLATNTTPRALMPAHSVGLKHGDGRFWCLTCHDAQDRDSLRTLKGTKIDFDQAWRVCGQCHQARMKDWYYGAHGKRFYSWKGKPVRYNCTQCHNPHRPPFMERKPQSPPPVRADLAPMHEKVSTTEALWDKHADRKVVEDGND